MFNENSASYVQELICTNIFKFVVVPVVGYFTKLSGDHGLAGCSTS